MVMPWPQIPNALKEVGPLWGKILIGCTKAFNTTFANIIQSQAKGFGDNRPKGFYCNDDSEAEKTAAEIIGEIGLEHLDAGPPMSARYLEPMIAFLISMTYNQGMGRDIAYTPIKVKANQR